MSRLLLLLAHSGPLPQNCGTIYRRLSNLAVLMTFLNADSKVIYLPKFLPSHIWVAVDVSVSLLCSANFTWHLKYFYCIVLYCTSAIKATADLVCTTTFIEVRFNTQHSIAIYLERAQHGFISFHRWPDHISIFTIASNTFPSQKAHRVALISISLALSQTSPYTARPQIWG